MKNIKFFSIQGSQYICIPVPTLQVACTVLEILKKDPSFTNGNYARYNMPKNWKIYQEDSIIVYESSGVITMSSAPHYAASYEWNKAIISFDKFFHLYGKILDPIPEMMKSLDLLETSLNV